MFSHDWVEVMQIFGPMPQTRWLALLGVSFRECVVLVWHLLEERGLIYLPQDKLSDIWEALHCPWISPP